MELRSPSGSVSYSDESKDYTDFATNLYRTVGSYGSHGSRGSFGSHGSFGSYGSFGSFGSHGSLE